MIIILTEKCSNMLDINNDLASQLQEGSDFTFRVTIIQASNINAEYTDIFCQFK